MTSQQHNVVVPKIPHIIFDDDELVDDSTDIVPISGLDTPLTVRDRYVRRLSRLLSASIQLREDTTDMEPSISIFLARNHTAPQHQLELDENLAQLLDTMKDSLSLTAMHKNEPQSERARDELWDSILIFAYVNVDNTIRSLKGSFNDNKDSCDDLVTKMFGIDEINGLTLDRELGDRLISLYHSVKAYSGSIRDLNSLVHFASNMTRALLHLQDRLKCLLRKARFANELYQLICNLGFPERVYNTLVRAARTSSTFRHIKFHLGPALPPKKVSSAKATTSPTTVSVPKTPLPEALKYPNTAVQPPSTANKAAKSSFGKAEMYLEIPDRKLGYLELQPTEKRQALIFAIAVLDKQYPSPTWKEYHVFGFSACLTEAQKQTLFGLYHSLLTEAVDKIAFFQRLWFALSRNELPQLFDASGYSWRNRMSEMVYFFSKPPQERPSVFRLIQFLHDHRNTQPLPCLQRDYGFSFCKQHEEVLRIKDVYRQLLRVLKPSDLHTACMAGELYELGYKHKIFIDEKNRRLMHNDYGNPYCGFDNGKGLQQFRGSLFKKKLK